jgi:hypothetical protein
VARNRKQIRLRTADALVLLNPEEPQKHLLRKIRDFVRISQARSQEAVQTPAVAACHFRDEVSVVGRQGSGSICFFPGL